MKKVFKVADIRKLDDEVYQGKISSSRMVEILNEMAYEAYRPERKQPDYKINELEDFIMSSYEIGNKFHFDIFEQYAPDPKDTVKIADDLYVVKSTYDITTPEERELEMYYTRVVLEKIENEK